MATRSSRRSVVTSSHTAVASTTTSTGRASAASASDAGLGESHLDISVDSVLSPTRTSRVFEKQQLQNLNDRLAAYIDRVRYLEAENQRLNVEIRSSEEIVTRERNNIRSAFEAELADARRLLDETAREKAKVQIEADKAKAEFDDLRARIAKLERDYKDSEKRRLYSDSMVQDLQAKLNTADSEKKHYEEEAKKLRGDNESLKKQLETARRQLEEETLLRVDLENRLQSMREELAFNKQLYEQELTEVRRRRDTEITEIGQDLENQYEAQLQKKLQEMRKQFDEQMKANRREVAAMYEAKISDLQRSAEGNRDAATQAREELHNLRMQLDSIEKERSRHETQVAMLEKKIRDLEDQLRAARDNFHYQLDGKEKEIRSLREEIDQMRIDFQDLLDTKIQLDVEIEAYRRLLEGEESRLKLSPSQSAEGPTPRPMKRKRLLQEEQETFETYTHRGQAVGNIEISEQDTEGNMVQIFNRGKKDQPIGGFVLTRVAGDQEVTYKFNPKQKIAGGKSITIYGKASGKDHKPPSDLLMKTNDQWPTGDFIRSSLADTDGDEIAWRESVRSTSGKRYSSRSAMGTADEFADPNQRCALM